METLHRARRAGRVPDTVLLVEHEPVITLGRGAELPHLLAPRAELTRRGVDVEAVGRGGDVTLHAPGQLVAYPIVGLAPDRCDVRRYVRDLTEVMRRLAREHGVDAGPSEQYIGLWVDGACPAHWPGSAQAHQPKKLGAIGVRLSRWVTMHGFAFNLTTDLELYRLIVPCGIREFGVTSIQELTGAAPEVQITAERALTLLAEVLDADVAGLEQSVTGDWAGDALSIVQ
jgi:lipoyl(octanoyl) transferase